MQHISSGAYNFDNMTRVTIWVVWVMPLGPNNVSPEIYINTVQNRSFFGVNWCPSNVAINGAIDWVQPIVRRKLAMLKTEK